jgi:hypothetical protein
MYIQNIIFIKQILGFGSDNILLKNFLFEKDMVFFDLFKTGELNDKVRTFSKYPDPPIIII